MSRPFSLDGLRPAGRLGRAAFAACAPLAERALGLAALDRLHRAAPPGCRGAAFLDWSLDALEVRPAVGPTDLARLPPVGAAIVASNHPFGAIEGLALGRLLVRRRDDVRLLANHLLERIPQLGELLIGIDPFGAPGAVPRNLVALRQAARWLDAGGMLVVFPAGEVASFDPRRRAVADPPWNPAVARLARHAGCPVVPVWFSGHNGLAFQLAGLVHPRLRTALLPRMLLARRGRPLELRIGAPVPGQRLAAMAGDRERTDYLRHRVEILGVRPPPLDRRPVQPRGTPAGARPVAAAPRPAELEREVAGLPAAQRLAGSGEQSVWLAGAEQIPAVLREIGRLREISFRAAGEGTGRELDLDRFDRHYRHLFIWSAAERAVIGAYRVGATDRILATHGLDGLYTSTLFRFAPALFQRMGPALELGRSFVRPEHQRSYAPLLLLWKGLGAWIAARPRYGTVFGPVSISAAYRTASQRLIVSFLEQNRFAHPWARMVAPRRPWSAAAGGPPRIGSQVLCDLDDVSAFIAEIEADRKGVPVLLKQYMRLGGRLLGFNVDPDFSNVLDVLLLVDLRQTGRRILERTMGHEGARAFLAAQREAPRAGEAEAG